MGKAKQAFGRSIQRHMGMAEALSGDTISQRTPAGTVRGTREKPKSIVINREKLHFRKNYAIIWKK